MSRTQEIYTRAAIALRGMRDEEGQGLVEYALILLLVALATFVVLGVLGDDLPPMFDAVENALDGDDGPPV